MKFCPKLAVLAFFISCGSWNQAKASGLFYLAQTHFPQNPAFFAGDDWKGILIDYNIRRPFTNYTQNLTELFQDLERPTSPMPKTFFGQASTTLFAVPSTLRRIHILFQQVVKNQELLGLLEGNISAIIGLIVQAKTSAACCQKEVFALTSLANKALIEIKIHLATLLALDENTGGYKFKSMYRLEGLQPGFSETTSLMCFFLILEKLFDTVTAAINQISFSDIPFEKT